MVDLKKKLSSLPMCPGVYIMKDTDGKVIYVGKSKVLKNRVSQYFVNLSAHTPKTRAMVSQIYDFEYIITDSESEALALECNLIKKYRPKYNILLKDDKQYPYIKITANEDFPRLFVTRRVQKDGGLYFGPYMTAVALKEAVEELRKAFRIRSCKKTIGKLNERPCLYYQIGQCSAPCAQKITKEEYGESISQISVILNGKYENIVTELQKKMQEASEKLEFEKAAQYRDKIKSITVLGENQKVSSASDKNMDVIGVYKEGDNFCIQIFYYRNGNAVGSEYFTHVVEYGEKAEILENFVKQFYFTASKIPGEILLSDEIDDAETIAQWLSDLCGHKVKFTVPQRGKKTEIMRMVVKNAEESLYKHQLMLNKDREKQNRILSRLCEVLNLSKTPFRIESYDISNISGESSVGVQIVYENAVPKKSLYRKYNIKSVTGADDYESTREVIFRRINEAYKEEDMIKSGELSPERAKFLPLPDLILLDGGKGHVSAVRMLMDTLGEEIPVFGLVKDGAHRTNGVTDSEQIFPIDKKSELFRFLAGMQDEVHRFAITSWRKRHEKKNLHSDLEKIEGVGPSTRKKLLKSFAGIKGIKNASVDELKKVVSEKLAKNIYEYFNKTGD